MGTYLSTPNTDKETEYGHGKHLSYGMCGMQGWRRTMEDAHICSIKLGDTEDNSLFAVFDGHGGAEVALFCAKHMAGELIRSAQYVSMDYDKALKHVFHEMDRLLLNGTYAEEVAAFKAASSGNDESVPSVLDGRAIANQLQEFKRIIIQSQARDPHMHAGCTAIVALKCGNTLYVANAGDSRGVLCRAGQAIALSSDHKPMNPSEKTRIESAGGTVSNANGVPRVNGNLNLSRAIGDLKYKDNADLPPEAQIITAQPDVRVFELSAADDFFLLACDGIWDVLSNEEVVSFVSEHLTNGRTPEDIASLLVEHCLSTDPKQSCGMGCDNMTVVLVVLQSGD